MGWTETNWRKGTKIKQWFEESYNQETDTVKQTILDAALVARTEAFAALETVNKTTGERTVSAVVVIMKFYNGGYYNFMYKDMHETCGPYICRCPKRIMKLLTPTDHEHALEWRQRVSDYWRERDKANKTRAKLSKGDTIVFKRPIRFNNGTTYKSLQVQTTKPLRLTDGSTNIFGYESSYYMSRRTLDSLIDHVIPSGQGQVERVIDNIKKEDMKKYPKYKYNGKEYTCILWAQAKNGWEWYGFELDDEENKIYFGYVMGFENEFGYFSLQELLDNGVKVVTDPDGLQELAPPIGPDWLNISA